jgi:hypothetical protein
MLPYDINATALDVRADELNSVDQTKLPLTFVSGSPLQRRLMN